AKLALERPPFGDLTGQRPIGGFNPAQRVTDFGPGYGHGFRKIPKLAALRLNFAIGGRSSASFAASPTPMI
ncbi:MAG: hypothetical protein AAFY56_07585, partial [Pseudomonadota bacterium]